MFNFKTAYNRDNFLSFLSKDFLPEDFNAKEENLSLDFASKYATTAVRLGKCSSLDLEVFEITHKSTHDARVGISRDAFQLLLRKSYCNRALVAFVPDGSKNYRFSLLQIEAEQNEQSSRITRNYSNPRRYSYFLGEDAHTKTPEQFLREKGRVKPKDGDYFKDLQERFSVEVLTKQFYQELFAWYQWALSEEIGVTFPNDRNTEKDDRQIEEHIIRLITRIMFVWFIKQKRLIPDSIFSVDKLESVLLDFDPVNTKQDNYYRAILQNLFFATLNNKIEDRDFAQDGTFHENKLQYGIKTLYRYADEFSISTNEVIELFSKVPFLNGGLFECLDKETPDSDGKIIYSDGFSRKKDRQSRAHIPNILFFENEKGLIPLLNKYNFTIEENTPSDIEVALDPELLGKVFENLLGTYNPETKETARKQSGSFYTPREIVDYMVDESIKTYLTSYLKCNVSVIDSILNENNDQPDLKLCSDIYKALLNIKIIDPACGSGAFPMGALKRILVIIEKLPLPNSISTYELKLHLIENCIYGVDIQSIAVQISKLRFFISLICEQTPNNNADNFGIKPLPNLETKFVAANTLIGLAKKNSMGNLFEDPQIEVTKKSLLEIRHLHFGADTSKKKREYRTEDKKLREKLAKLLEENNDFAPDDAKQLALWNPYDQNTHAEWFDVEWMFGLKQGFDIVIGNPPYVQMQNNGGFLSGLYQKCQFKTFERTGDLYSLFYERGYELLREQGKLCFITSNKWMRAGYGASTRKFFAENTNPELLIDFAGVKIFESATVDTNILLFSKEKNKGNTKACIFKSNGIKELSVFINQNAVNCNFNTSESWVILSPIEQQIKAKIEAVGTPLKDCDINIYRGILTGYNDAFIITGEKKNELIAQDPKSADIIRPILRGRDIKRYGYEFADLWLINSHNGIKEKGINPININEYPAVKAHLDQYWDKISIRSDKGDTPYNLRNCSYLEDFSNQKIIYPNMTKYMPFYLDNKAFYSNQKCFIITGSNISFLTAFLNSSLFKFCFRDSFPELQGGTRELSKIFFDKIPVLQVSEMVNRNFENMVLDIQNKKQNNLSTKQLELDIDNLIFDLYKLTQEERQEIGFIEIQ